MEMSNLLFEEVEQLGSKLKWIEADTIEISNLIKLLIASQKNCEDTSVKTVLDILDKKLNELLVEGVMCTYINVDNISKVAKNLEAEQSKPKRTRKPRTVTQSTNKGGQVKRTRKPAVKEEVKVDESKETTEEDKKA